jgi:glycerate kinase
LKRIIVAPDSFKESLKASEAAAMMASGIRRVLPEAEVVEVPLSDGGEGLTECLVSARGGRVVQREVTGPLGEKITAEFGILDDGVTGVVETAAAAGLALVPRERRNPMITTTYGMGELMRAALDAGCKRIIVGLGGSATNDGGAGMAQALGFRLLNDRKRDIGPGGGGLMELAAIDGTQADPRLAHTEILGAYDVDNPLYGPEGAAYTYSRQKGATAEMVELLDRALLNLAQVVKRDLKLEIDRMPGVGAAGGLGAGLAAFAGAKLRPGLELVFDMIDFYATLQAGADLIITGEGEINLQSLRGKVPVGVARQAKKFGCPVLAVVGSIGTRTDAIYQAGIDAIMSVAPGPISREESMTRAGELVTDATGRALRMMLIRL